ncbi:MAG: alpha/beta hydrolase [Bacteroidota bacterium]
MKKSSIFIAALLLAGLVLLPLLFIPSHYSVKAFQERTGTQYWELKTGSKIGYIKIASSQPIKKSPILYLHGGPGGVITDQIIDALRPLAELGHDLYFYDQIGSGHSKRLEDISEYTVSRHQEDLYEILLKIQANQVILIGKSWGACLATNFLQNHEDKVDRLILVGPGPILPINNKVINNQAPDSLALVAPAFSNKEGNESAYNWRSQFVSKWAYLFQTKWATDQEMDAFFTHLNKALSQSTDCQIQPNKKQTGGGGFYSHIMTLKSLQEVENKRHLLKQSKVPLLLLRGQCDNQKWGFAQEYLDIFPHSKLKIIEDAGHNIINSKKEEYYELIKAFLTATHLSD